MQKIVITGVNGIIGSELGRRFINKGYYVIGIDRVKSKEKEGNGERGQFEYVKLDITDKDKVGQFFQNYVLII